MKWDHLLSWMAHVGSGSWQSFKRALRSISEAADPDEIRALSARLSEMAIADFFVAGSSTWRSLETTIVASPHLPQEAFLCGARTSQLIEAVRRTAESHTCRCLTLADQGGFTTAKLLGPAPAAVAAAVGIAFDGNIAESIAAGLKSLDDVVRAAAREAPPRGWSARWLDFNQGQWASGTHANAFVEFSSRYMQRRYYVFGEENELPLRLPKREALYEAARRCRRGLLRYDPRAAELSTPIFAPLPEQHARALVLAASGRASQRRQGRIVYSQVPAQLAGVVLASLRHTVPLYVECGERSGGRR